MLDTGEDICDDGRTMGKRKGSITRVKKAAAAAMMELGASTREVAREIGISKSAAALLPYDPTLDEAEVERVKSKLQGRLIVASDRFLSHSLDRLQDLHPYQAMLCAGIAHDHYLRSRASSSGSAMGGLTQILVLIDQRATASITPPTKSDTPAHD